MCGEDLDNYRSMLSRCVHSLTRTIGIHVMAVVLERALWTVKHTHEEATLIVVSEDGINLDGLSQVESGKARQIIDDFQVAIVAVLGNLVGGKLAHELVDRLSAESGEEEILRR